MICKNHEGQPPFLHEAVDKLVKKSKKQRTFLRGRVCLSKKARVYT